MTQVSLRKHWPYDELQASRIPGHANRFVLKTPWLTLQSEVSTDVAERTWDLLSKMNASQITIDELPALSEYLGSLSTYSLTYLLPRTEEFGLNEHKTQADPTRITALSPQDLLRELCPQRPETENVLRRLNLNEWAWDTDAAQDFSCAPNGFDPETLFTVARRYHLLTSLERNQTTELFAHLRELSKNPTAFRGAAAWVIRQNHYITQRCESVLREALPIAQNAEDAVLDFIQAESGHEHILARALRSLTGDPEAMPLVGSAIVTMDLFAAIARRNLLAFAMVVDIFERTSYGDGDPLAVLLEEAGETIAAQQIDRHRAINDAGGHENLGLSFLRDMKAVDANYAIEAMRLAELLTLVILQISPETLEGIRTP